MAYHSAASRALDWGKPKGFPAAIQRSCSFSTSVLVGAWARSCADASRLPLYSCSRVVQSGEKPGQRLLVYSSSTSMRFLILHGTDYDHRTLWIGSSLPKLNMCTRLFDISSGPFGIRSTRL